MCRVHHAHPLRRIRLERGDAIAHAIHKDFPAATRHTAQTRRRKDAQDFLHRLVEKLRERHELARAEAMHVEAGELGLDVCEQIEIPLLRQLRMMPALHENLVATERDGLLDFFVQLVERDDVGIVVLLRAIERAELAIDVADVRVVDVAINNVGDDAIALAAVRRAAMQLPPPVCQRAQFFQRQRREPPGVIGIDAPAVPDFLQQAVE